MIAEQRRSGRCVCLALLLAATGCQTARRDAFGQAQQALHRDDLAVALQAFDSVPASDLRYPEARLWAAAVEGRLRRHKELLLRGLVLRGQWRDDEALAMFRGALDAWPGHAETQALIAATQQRAKVGSGPQRDTAPPVTAVAAPTAAAVPPPTPALASPLVESAPDAAAPVPVAPPRSLSADAVGAELAAIELRLATGELEQVLSALFQLNERAPGDARIGARLARLLQQRGLLRYGQGQVAGAIADWQRAVELDPGTRAAQVLLEMARRELARPPR